ncbi:hypothetical protein [Nonomuraea sp. B5E05]|uniref:hypothetical protein n=1 Tax=Nonomuraea sp. B5E05 TaxID=3153569 RepID=UPI0032607C54
MSVPEMPVVDWTWHVARDPRRVHALLRDCDAHQAARWGSPVPVRRIARTEQLVAEGAVHLLLAGDQIAGSFTLTWPRPGAGTGGGYPPARHPGHLSRLCVEPGLIDAGRLVGVQCVRKAIELAVTAGADALRAEANPDLADTLALLRGLGFKQHGQVESDGPRRWVRIQKPLRVPS